MDNTFSIILPTYNRAERLKKSLSNYLSVLDGDKIQFLIMDNASPDNTEEVVKEFISKYDNIKYIKNNINIGAGRSIYRGFLEVKTKYFMILADDDLITKGFFRLILNSIEKYPMAGVINHAPKNEDLNGMYQQNSILKQTTYLNKGEEAFKITFNASGVIPGIVYKRNLINQDLWLLDNSIYPQIRLACEISINHSTLYLVSDESILIPENGTVMSIAKGRPLDYGIFERLEILLNVSKKLPIKEQQDVIISLTLSLFVWGSGIFTKMYKEDKMHAYKYLKTLSDNHFIGSSILFYFIFFRISLFEKEIGYFDKTKIIFKLSISMLRSILNKNLYKSIFYAIKKIIKKLTLNQKC